MGRRLAAIEVVLLTAAPQPTPPSGTAPVTPDERAPPDDIPTPDVILICGQNPGTNHPRMDSVLDKAKRRCPIWPSIPCRRLGLPGFRMTGQYRVQHRSALAHPVGAARVPVRGRENIMRAFACRSLAARVCTTRVRYGTGHYR
jgi:hypothetical protein